MANISHLIKNDILQAFTPFIYYSTQTHSTQPYEHLF